MAYDRQRNVKFSFQKGIVILQYRTNEPDDWVYSCDIGGRTFYLAKIKNPEVLQSLGLTLGAIHERAVPRLLADRRSNKVQQPSLKEPRSE